MDKGYLYEFRGPDGRHLYFVSSRRELVDAGGHLCTVAHFIPTRREKDVVQF